MGEGAGGRRTGGRWQCRRQGPFETTGLKDPLQEGLGLEGEQNRITHLSPPTSLQSTCSGPQTLRGATDSNHFGVPRDLSATHLGSTRVVYLFPQYTPLPSQLIEMVSLVQ